MKKLLLSFFFLFSFLFAQSQELTVNVIPVVHDGKTDVYITGENFAEIGALGFSFNFDTTLLTLDTVVLTYVEYLNSSYFGISPIGNLLIASIPDDFWDFEEETVLMVIRFEGEAVGDCSFEIVDEPNDIQIITIWSEALEDEDYVINDGTCLYSKLSGSVFFDQNNNCIYDAGDVYLPQVFVHAEGDNVETTLTNEAGYYDLFLGFGEYDISVYSYAELWESCEPVYTLNIDQAIDPTPSLDIPVQPITDCPSVKVDVGVPFLRRCFPNSIEVSYCNLGSVLQENTVLEVTLDPYLSYDSCSITPTSIDGQVLRFNVGDLEPGACGDFQVYALVSCESLLGQTHCIKAEVLPNNYCFIDPAWSEASLTIDGICTGDQVIFRVENTGDGDQTESSSYTILQNDLIFQQGEIPNLISGEYFEFELPANGTTWRLEVDQVPFHPGNSNPSYFVEGCASGNQAISLGYAMQFPADDGDLFVDYECHENIGSYDPNDKTGFPLGFGPDQLLEPNTDIHYHIRFQNTGTDTAFRVIILDTILAGLDIETVKPGNSSHPYEFDVIDNTYLQFTFNDIMLPDSASSLEASQGFVSFDIQQMLDNPIGTTIDNTAAIYFDFNEPIITNNVHYEIGVIELDTVVNTNVIDRQVEDLVVKVFPNPSKRDQVHFHLMGTEDYPSFELTIFDLLGRTIIQEKGSGTSLQVDTQHLKPGVYTYQVRAKEHSVMSGKLIVQ